MTTLVHVAAPARLLRTGFWRDYWITMRPYLLFVSGITGIAGLALGSPLSAPSLAALALAFFLAYGFGQALTDCFQLDTDTLSAPYRPMVRGTIRPTDVLGVSLAGLGISSVVIGAHALATLPLCALTVVGLATYTWFKRRWWGGPFYNAWIVAVVLLIGFVATGGTALRSLPLLAALGTAFFGYANFVLVGYYKDIPADRATGYRTFPVVFGLGRAHAVSDAFAVLATASAMAALVTLGARGGPFAILAAAPFALGALATQLVAQVRTHTVTSHLDAHRAIAPVVHAYILLLSAIAAAAHPTWMPGLFVFYGGFVLTLHHRPMAEQI
jgi:4-hydroxybenzoate polyprenyltransferase